jgi:hypothetical protein
MVPVHMPPDRTDPADQAEPMITLGDIVGVTVVAVCLVGITVALVIAAWPSRG